MELPGSSRPTGNTNKAHTLQSLRSVLFSIAYSLLTFFYGALSIPLWLLPLALRHKIILSWASVVVFLAKAVCGIRYRIVGLEHLEGIKQRPVVILSKHQSAWETFFLQSIFAPASTVLKKELLSIPFFGWGLASLRPIAIDRSNPREALRQVKIGGELRLSQGMNIILFPEGTRTPIGERGKYARSGADIAIAAQCDIIPVAHDAGKCWIHGTKTSKKAGEITVVIGKPISFTAGNSKELIQQVEDWIETTQEKIYSNSL